MLHRGSLKKIVEEPNRVIQRPHLFLMSDLLLLAKEKGKRFVYVDHVPIHACLIYSQGIQRLPPSLSHTRGSSFSVISLSLRQDNEFFHPGSAGQQTEVRNFFQLGRRARELGQRHYRLYVRQPNRTASRRGGALQQRSMKPRFSKIYFIPHHHGVLIQSFPLPHSIEGISPAEKSSRSFANIGSSFSRVYNNSASISC